MENAPTGKRQGGHWAGLACTCTSPNVYRIEALCSTLCVNACYVADGIEIQEIGASRKLHLIIRLSLGTYQVSRTAPSTAWDGRRQKERVGFIRRHVQCNAVDEFGQGPRPSPRSIQQPTTGVDKLSATPFPPKTTTTTGTYKSRKYLPPSALKTRTHLFDRSPTLPRHRHDTTFPDK